MSQIYFESKSLENLSNKELYYRFKIVEKRNNLVTNSKIPFEMKMELENLYNLYMAEIDSRIASHKLSLDDVDDWDDFFYEHEKEFMDLSNSKNLDDEHINGICNIRK